MIYGGEKEFCVQNSSDFLKQHVEPGGANFAINLGCKWALSFPFNNNETWFPEADNTTRTKTKAL
jgi:hypothetical protein